VSKKVKAIVASVVIVVLVGTVAGLAIALPGDSGHRADPSSTTVATISEEAAPEEVSETTTTMVANPTNEQISKVQQRLTELGYWVGPVDGKPGQATQQALMAFQKLNGLAKTGALDTATANALVNAKAPTAASTTGDLIEIDKARQVIYVVRGGRMLWVFNSSTGTERSYVTNGVKGFAHTPSGTFRVGRTVDAVDPGPLGPLYRPRYFTNNGIAVHGAAAIPATPASHGCARVSNAAMDFIWANNLMPVQSFVWVYTDAAAEPFAPPAPTSTTPSSTTTSSTTTTTQRTTTTTTTTTTPPPPPSSTTTSSTTTTSTSTTSTTI